MNDQQPEEEIQKPEAPQPQPEVVLKEAADVLLRNPIEVKVLIKPGNRLHAWLQKMKIRKKEKIFLVHPLYLGTLLRISKLLLSIDMDGVKASLNFGTELEMAGAEILKMAKVIAYALHNKKSEPPESLVNFVMDNFTTREMYQVVLVVVGQMDVRNFTLSIISIRVVGILEKPDVNVKPASAKEMSL